MTTLSCVTDFISDTLDHLWNIILGALVVWFLVIATQVIQDQRADEPKDDVQQEWEVIGHYIKQHAKIAAAKIKLLTLKQR